MRTKDELFRAAQREVAGYRQQAVMQAETTRRAAYAAHPALAEADAAHIRAGLGLAKAAALGSSMDSARAALARADVFHKLQYRQTTETIKRNFTEHSTVPHSCHVHSMM